MGQDRRLAVRRQAGVQLCQHLLRGVEALGDLFGQRAVAHPVELGFGPRAPRNLDELVVGEVRRDRDHAGRRNMLPLCQRLQCRLVHSPVIRKPRASWKPLMALTVDMPILPSITPGVNPIRSSTTCACIRGRGWSSGGKAAVGSSFDASGSAGSAAPRLSPFSSPFSWMLQAARGVRKNAAPSARYGLRNTAILLGF